MYMYNYFGKHNFVACFCAFKSSSIKLGPVGLELYMYMYSNLYLTLPMSENYYAGLQCGECIYTYCTQSPLLLSGLEG